jgi:hypothetical protein
VKTSTGLLIGTPILLACVAGACFVAMLDDAMTKTEEAAIARANALGSLASDENSIVLEHEKRAAEIAAAQKSRIGVIMTVLKVVGTAVATVVGGPLAGAAVAAAAAAISAAVS